MFKNKVKLAWFGPVALSVATTLLAGFNPLRNVEAAQPGTNGAKKEQHIIHLCTQKVPGSKGGVPYDKQWTPGRTLKVYLMGGSKVVRAKVRERAVQWNQFSSVTFQFVDMGPAEVRVSFVPDNSSWSYVGTDCADIPDGEPTMNFGWLTDTSAEDEFSRVVLHEFGHALGLIHEHQNPVAGIPWDKPKVYDYYRAKGWPRAQVDQNIFRTYDKSTTQFSAFDSESIMLYAIPAELTTNGYSVGWNRTLSVTDKEFIARVYPKDARAMMSGGAPTTNALAAKTTETGLQANGPEVKDAPRLQVFERPRAMADGRPPAGAPAPVPIAPKEVPPLAQERQGTLESYIRNNPSVRTAERLRSDPRLNSLQQPARADFLNEFGNLMFSKTVPSRDSLLERTSALDIENTERNDRSIRFREDAAAFRVDEAGLDAEIQRYEQKVADYSNDLKSYEADLAIFTPTAADYGRRTADQIAQVSTHKAELGNYTQQCLSGPLEPGPFARCNAWQQTLNSRANTLNNWKAQLDVERAKLAQDKRSLDERLVSLTSRRADLTTVQAQLQVRYDTREKRRAELLAEEKKLADWEVTIKPQWDFEVKNVDQWRALLDKFNARLEKALAGVPAPTSPKAGWTGNWNDKEKGIVTGALQGLKDDELRGWITANVQLNRFKDDTSSPITASGSVLRVKDGFFSGEDEKAKARRENLIAFEAGKLFWNNMKDKPVGEGKTLEAWFIGYYGGHFTAIGDMHSTKHGKEDLPTTDRLDAPSSFAHVFRAKALQLEKPTGEEAQREWDGVMREFQTRISQTLHEKQ